MPIKGLTKDVPTTLRGGLIQLGSLRKGAPQQNQKVGKDLEYFRVDFAPQFAHMQPAFEEMYGAEPKEFSGVILTANTVDGAFDSWMEQWTSGTHILKQRCDGEQRVLWYDFDNSCYSDTPMPCLKDSEQPCKCQRSGRLHIILPEFCQRVSTLGYFTVHTGAIRDIAAIYNALSAATNMNVELTQITWTIGRAMQQVAMTFEDKDGKTKRKLDEQAVFYMTPDARFVQKLIAQSQSGFALPASTQGNDLDMLTQDFDPDDFIVSIPERSSVTDEDTGEIINQTPAPPPADEEEELFWDGELLVALHALTGNSTDGLCQSLNKYKAEGKFDTFTPTRKVFEHVWQIVNKASNEKNPDGIAHLLLDKDRKQLRTFQVFAAVHQAVRSFNDRGNPDEEQVALLVELIWDMVGYGEDSEAREALDKVSQFLFDVDTQAIKKKQLRGIQNWLCFTDDAGQIFPYPTALDELGALLECAEAMENLTQ